MSNRTSHGFEKLARNVQRWIWDKGWNELRGIQEEAIAPILSADRDVIISSATASGKTEAAYLPICSHLVSHPGNGIRLLYISPLKALIDDQYHRLEELCEYCDIPVHRWHGDISSGKKKKLIDKPDGLLLITPESLEAIFVNHGTKIERLFKYLNYVVIDELHSFLDNERGKQLQSLLCRLELVVGSKIPRIGLSATIGDLSIAARYLRKGETESVKIINSQTGERELRLQIRGYKKKMPCIQEPDPAKREHIVEHMFNTFRGSDNLIFANSRGNVEEYSDKLRQLCNTGNLPVEFFPHHGSLARDIRYEAETRLKDKHLPANVICTTTLEMGIDIGSVKSIAQIDCPFSVAGLRQRLGRSGRKDGDPSILRIYIEEDEVEEKSPPDTMIRERLFQGIAMTELLLKKWVEPPDSKKLHLSTLIQQLLSIIAQYGGIKADTAWKILCGQGPFNVIDQKDFVQLLRNLGKEDILMQMNDGILVLGVKGERIVNHYSFYAAFMTYDEYRLISIPDGKTLGTLPIDFPIFEGVYIIFAGRRWTVTDVNEEQKFISLMPAPGGKPPAFSCGEALVDDEIRKEMYNLYLSDYIPIYLDEEAVKLLTEGRDNFKRLGLDKCNWIRKGDATYLFPWVGDKGMNTLFVMLMSKGGRVGKFGCFLEVNDISAEMSLSLLKTIKNNSHSFDVMELAAIPEGKTKEKYDHLLPENLLCAEYAARSLDVEKAFIGVNTILEGKTGAAPSRTIE